MKIKIFFLVSLCITSLAFAEDAPKPSTKKEIFASIPHVWISEGILCLRAKETNLYYANQAQDISSSNFTNTPLIRPQSIWNLGVMINLGYQPKKQYYFASWSYIQNKAFGTQSTNGSRGFFPVMSFNRNLTNASTITSANLYWRLNTQLADVGTMFPLRWGQFFLLKSHVGLRLASLNQKLKTYYGGGIFSQGTDVLTSRNNFFGVGPRVGVIPNIFLPLGFSLCGEVAVSELLGRFYVKQQESYLNLTTFRYTRVMTRFRCCLDGKAYLAWQKELFYKSLIISLQIGWQWQEFFNQNQLKQNAFHLSTNNNNIFSQGGFFSLCVAF